MKSLFNVKKHFAIFAIMATAMMLPDFALAGEIKGTHNVDDNGKCECSTCKSKDYYIIVYKADKNIDLGHDNGAAKKSPFDLTHYAGYAAVSLNGVSGYFGWFFDAVVSEAIKAKNQNSASNSLGVTGLVLPAGFETIDAGAFAGYDGLTSISLPSTVKTIEAGAFQGCSSLTEVTIPGSCETIGNNAFQGCTNLETVTFEESNEGVTLNVGANAFNNCNSLTTVVVESENTNISSNAFSGTTNVTNVTGSVTQVENIAGGSTSGAGSTTTKPTATVVLKDNESLDPSKYVIKATGYIRENVTNAWGTLCLPFAVSSDENVQFYQLSNVDFVNDVMEFSEVAKVGANTPCVFQNLSGNTTLSFSTPDPATLPSGEIVNHLFGDWSMVGSFQALDFYVTEPKFVGKNIYCISGGKFWQAIGHVTSKPCRAYFVYEGTLPASAASSRFSIEVNENMFNETGLNSVSVNEHAEDALYDLLGNRVDKMVKGRIYIMNGKKVMFK